MSESQQPQDVPAEQPENKETNEIVRNIEEIPRKKKKLSERQLENLKKRVEL